MYILTIWWGFSSGASLHRENSNKSVDLIAASSEERFCRIKNTSNFPIQTIEWLKSFLKKNESFDKIIYTSNDVGVDYLLCDKGTWSVGKHITENLNFWKPHLLDGNKGDYLDYLKNELDLTVWPGENFWQSLGLNKTDTLNTNKINEAFSQKYPELLSVHFGIATSDIHRIDHHASHRHYAISNHPDLPRRSLVFTVDGWGDGRNATVSIVENDNNQLDVREIFSSKNCSLARTYRFITLLLGMKPSEHEFKVMGLASYGKKEYSDRALEIFRKSMTFSKQKGDFNLNNDYKDSFFTFRELLIGERFDNIASGLQLWLEEVLKDWVLYFVSKTGIKDVSFSGGVAMNVKAMSEINSLNQVGSVFVPPSAGDESQIFGAFYCYYFLNNNSLYKNSKIPYCGYEENAIYEKEFLIKNSKTYSINEIDLEFIAEKISKGKIVAVSRGKSEFGARALGNRSFFIDPTKPEAKNKLNIAVKNRDFWMPFAPIILDKYILEYINEDDIENTRLNRFMTSIFRTKSAGVADLPSALHSSDQTCRAQVLIKEDNPFVYSLIEHFSLLTGRGALLNTSFNVHGLPIVNKIDDAFQIFIDTPTDFLITNKYMISKSDDA